MLKREKASGKTRSFGIVSDDNAMAAIEVTLEDNSKLMVRPQEVATKVLRHMLDIAEKHISMPVNMATITVPAYFDNRQREATLEAAVAAGLRQENVRLIKEPCAAAMAYGLNFDVKNKTNVLIYDLGGGTFDVTIMEITQKSYNVKNYDGDSSLGGADFDNRLVAYFAEKIREKFNKDVYTDSTALFSLKDACESAKKQLTGEEEAVVRVASLFPGVEFKQNLSRDTFNTLCQDLFDQTIAITQRAVTAANLTPKDIDEVVMVGGSTKIKKIQEMVRDLFGGLPLCRRVNPDEVIASGAAVHGAIVSCHVPGRKLKDTTSHGFGTDVDGGKVCFLIPKNTSLPVKKRQRVFKTVYDNQPSFNFEIYEGESIYQKECALIGSFKLHNIALQKKGKTKCRCIFEIDDNGILKVSSNF